MTLDEIIEECTQTGVFDGYKLPFKKVPIFDKNGNTVGFYAPKKRHKRNCMGFVYISKKYRRKGYALKACIAFKKRNPGMLWFVKDGDHRSQKLACKAGLQFIGDEITKNGNVFHVYEDIDNPEKTKVRLLTLSQG